MKKIISGSITFLFAAALPLLAQSNPQPEIKWDRMDLGAFHSGFFKVQDQIVAKGIAIKVGAPEDGATILFDPELMRVSAAWTGGFIRFPRGRGGLEGQTTPGGTRRFSTAYAPGWSGGEIEKDPRPNHQGNLPPENAKWHGLYTNGENVVLHYAIQKIPVLELPGYEKRGATGVFTRTIQIGKSTAPLTMLVADVPGGVGSAQGTVARLTTHNPDRVAGDAGTAIALNRAPPGARLEIGVNGRVVLRLPALPTGALFQVAIASAKAAELPGSADLQKAGTLINPATLTKGGTLRWGVPLVTTGAVSQDRDASYVVDDIPLPDNNPFHSWLRPGGHDFFPNGTVALVNVSGDVWIVGGLDEELKKVTWKRFATGLSQPLGCKVVDGKIHVLGRDQITRLHDLNNDGEADYYENFNNDCVATDNYHEFALDLQTDSKGDFFYAKGTPWTPTNTSPHQGTLIKVTKDGRRLEIFATGLRAPNGLGIGPQDELTVSDNQGHWTPANRLNLVKRGGFYGMTPSAHRVLTFRTPDGQEFQANPSEPAARTQFKTEFWGKPTDPVPVEHDLPLCWIPMQIDNSSGGQIWVPPGDKWGPLAGRMLFLSYGKCALFNVFSETVEGQVQGGLCRLPLKFTSGIMRARFSPRDGQLYVSGLNVWQSSAAKDGCFQRVRYTGRPATLPVELNALAHGVALKFTAPLDPASATDPQNFSVERWNYAWTGAYGSPDISIADPKKKGRDLVFIDKITLSPDRLTLTIALPEMGPAMQMRIKYKLQDAAGQVVAHEIHNTINRLPGQKAAGS